MYDRYGPYVSVAERRRKAVAELAKLAKKGHVASPVEIVGRGIATTVWGKAWCTNLESYSDYANRLPRGRTYVRNGSVVDLQLRPGLVEARVSGSSLYRVTLTITALPAPRWDALCTDCAGGIDSLVELLQGRLSAGVMERLCRPRVGLFPAPNEIQLACSCPDGASMCKHVAATLYGIGARLDHQPELLFVLRQVDATALLANAGAALGSGAPIDGGTVLDGADLGALFGLDLDLSIPEPVVVAPVVATPAKPAATKARAKVAPARASKAAAPARPVPMVTQLLLLLREHGPMTIAQVEAALAATPERVRALLEHLIVVKSVARSGRGEAATYRMIG